MRRAARSETLATGRSFEYVTQVTAIGPLGLDYIDPGDDPRNA
jgi:hypothetical protein